MEPEVQIRQSSRKKKSKLQPVLFIVITLIVLSATIFSYLVLQNDTVYRGVHVGNLDMSGRSLNEMHLFLENAYRKPADTLKIALKSGKTEISATYSELGVDYDLDQAAENAYAVGRSGNIFQRLSQILQARFNGVFYEVPQTFDKAKIDNFVARFAVNNFQSLKEGILLISDNTVVIRSGRHGEDIDKNQTASLVADLIRGNKDGVIQPEIKMTYPGKFNADDIYDQITVEPADAAFRVENASLVPVPHVVGRNIDKNRLVQILAELEQSEDSERVLPVTFTKPAITSDMVSSMLFKDELASYHSTFSTASQNGKNRKHNMTLAVNKIDNLILLPGEEFSYNKVVGPRDVEHGYKTAHVYIQGKIEDGIGGGICQVSTTMYNAVLTADLKVTERRNHSFIVTYVPLGQDATAYYGGTDFRFVNSTKWPMRLNASVEGNKIAFRITGTRENPDKSVIISSKVLKETPHQITKIPDPTLAFGKTKEKQEGLNGYVVETYKTVKVGGKVVSQTKLHTSRYNPCPQILLVGTKGAPATTPGAVTAAPAGGVPKPDPAPGINVPAESETGEPVPEIGNETESVTSQEIDPVEGVPEENNGGTLPESN